MCSSSNRGSQAAYPGYGSGDYAAYMQQMSAAGKSKGFFPLGNYGNMYWVANWVLTPRMNQLWDFLSFFPQLCCFVQLVLIWRLCHWCWKRLGTIRWAHVKCRASAMFFPWRHCHGSNVCLCRLWRRSLDRDIGQRCQQGECLKHLETNLGPVLPVRNSADLRDDEIHDWLCLLGPKRLIFEVKTFLSEKGFGFIESAVPSEGPFLFFFFGSGRKKRTNKKSSRWRFFLQDWAVFRPSVGASLRKKELQDFSSDGIQSPAEESQNDLKGKPVQFEVTEGKAPSKGSTAAWMSYDVSFYTSFFVGMLLCRILGSSNFVIFCLILSFQRYFASGALAFPGSSGQEVSGSQCNLDLCIQHIDHHWSNGRNELTVFPCFSTTFHLRCSFAVSNWCSGRRRTRPRWRAPPPAAPSNPLARAGSLSWPWPKNTTGPTNHVVMGHLSWCHWIPLETLDGPWSCLCQPSCIWTYQGHGYGFLALE